MNNDSIAAVATAPGRAALAVIRLSGKSAFKIFSRLIDEKAAHALEDRKAKLLKIYSVDSSTEKAKRQFIDECVVVPYVAPHSYSGEDLIEIFCHGGTLVPNLILDSLVEAGARLAQPGEFTLRAFLNNKMDLAQAESIESIVSSKTISELRLAHYHYSGQFSNDIKKLRSDLIDLLSLLELELDFSDEEVEFASRSELLNRLNSLDALLQDLVHSFNRAHILREGIYVAIVGRPNVGKSSLLNLLLKRERAIVTDIPGTTRDVIEETIDISGYKFVFVDTAGIRNALDIVEQEGIRRSESVLKAAPIVTLLVEKCSHLQKEDWEVRQRILQYGKNQQKRKILLLNKSDLSSVLLEKELKSFASGFEVISLSCRTGAGLRDFENAMIGCAKDIVGDQGENRMTVVSLRQKEAALRALTAIHEAQKHFRSGLSQEFIAADIRLGLEALAELIGEVTSEDILENIFAHFCIGK